MNIDADGSLIDITVVLVNNHLTDVNFENIVERIDSAHLEAKQYSSLCCRMII